MMCLLLKKKKAEKCALCLLSKKIGDEKYVRCLLLKTKYTQKTFFVSTFLDKYISTTTQGEKHKTKMTKLPK